MPTLAVVCVVFWAQDPVPSGQQLQFGSSGHQPLARVKHVTHVTTVSGNGSYSDQRPAMQLRVPGFGSGNVEAPPKFGDHGPD